MSGINTLQLLHLQPLWGGGFMVALSQLALFYYGLGAVLQWVVPQIIQVQGIQEQPRKPGEVSRDAISSIGKLLASKRVCCTALLNCFTHNQWRQSRHLAVKVANARTKAQIWVHVRG